MKLLTLQEAMNLFGVSRATIDRWRQSKQLPFIKIGKEVFIDAMELEEWIHSYSTRTKPAAGTEKEVLKVSIGYQSGTAHMWSPLIIKQLGLFEEELRRYYPEHLLDIRWYNGSNGLELVESLIAGKLQLASLGDYPIAIASALSRILPSFQAALLAFDGKTANGKGISVVVQPSSGIEKLSDLSGTSISTVVNSSAGYRLQQLLSSIGEQETRMVHREMGDCLSGIQEKRIGASVMWEPYVSLLRDSGTGRILQEEGLGTDYLTGVIADERWASQNEAVVIAYLKAHLRAHHMIRCELDKVVTLIHMATGFPPPVIRSVLSRVRWDAAVYARDLRTLDQLNPPSRLPFERQVEGQASISCALGYLQSALEQMKMPLLNDDPLQGDWSADLML